MTLQFFESKFKDIDAYITSDKLYDILVKIGYYSYTNDQIAINNRNDVCKKICTNPITYIVYYRYKHGSDLTIYDDKLCVSYTSGVNYDWRRTRYNQLQERIYAFSELQLKYIKFMLHEHRSAYFGINAEHWTGYNHVTYTEKYIPRYTDPYKYVVDKCFDFIEYSEQCSTAEPNIPIQDKYSALLTTNAKLLKSLMSSAASIRTLSDKLEEIMNIVAENDKISRILAVLKK